MAFTEEEKKGFVKEIQSYLRSIAYFNKNIPMIIPSGVMDEPTKKSVSEFQRIYGLSVTGDIDAQTYGAIVEIYKEAIRKRASPDAARPFKDGHLSIKSNEEGANVNMLQVMLSKIAEKYPNIGECDITGEMDSKTSRMVSHLQEIMGFPPTGEVDAQTWNMIVRIYNTLK